MKPETVMIGENIILTLHVMILSSIPAKQREPSSLHFLHNRCTRSC